jgi:hypothetical protein
MKPGETVVSAAHDMPDMIFGSEQVDNPFS